MEQAWVSMPSSEQLDALGVQMTGHPYGFGFVPAMARLILAHARIAPAFGQLFNSVMFPSIFTLGIAKLGPLTGDGSGLLIMAIVGGAIIPVIQGIFADHFGIHHAFFLPAICYLYIVYYALKGSRPALTT